MDPREKILKEFDTIIAASEPSKHDVSMLLRDLYNYCTGGEMFIIGEKDDFTVKKVEGDTFFNSYTRVLHLGVINEATKKYAFDTLLNMMFYYQYILENPDDKFGYKRNTEKKLAYEYVTAAITEHFLHEFCRPDPEIEAIIAKFGLIEEFIVIKMFTKKYIRMIEYEGDLGILLLKIQGTMKMYFETLEDTSQDAAMLDTLGKNASLNATDNDQEELLKNLLENLTID
nr:hypothetical protein [Candidatus Sigynarchaeota archaeon]